MSSTTPPVTATMLCTHAPGTACTSAVAGHAVSAIRDRVTAATPSKWRDGLVVHVSSIGAIGGSWLAVALLDQPDAVWVWNHDDLSSVVSIGEPVALHELYDTLAVGSTRVSVLRAPR
ncbi:hypothetical protein [Lacisediminihabitans sp. H27-G8]|uniref:hypothetical protein n=1 Tax=Lacisediminihabitans sp. H27-G8 TaxID=3111909 RepID=UPI0038FC633C